MFQKPLLILFAYIIFIGQNFAQNTINIPNEGWRMWPDTEATWENDSLFLPNEFHLEDIPSNDPTGGWEVLNDAKGVSVTLPATVEQYYWGKLQGQRAFENSYYREQEDTVVKDGSYKGVSWWWTTIEIPNKWRDRHVIIHVPGARLRAEVYLNGHLVGYHMIGETSFQCDITAAIEPGRHNQLAIRVTNPGGRLDGVDTELMKWGNYEFHASHGFGGLDHNLTLEVHDDVFIKDLYVLNLPELDRVDAYYEVQNNTSKKQTVLLDFVIYDQKGQPKKVYKDEKIVVPAHTSFKSNHLFVLEKAVKWTLENPVQYKMVVRLSAKKADSEDVRKVRFGFRWFGVENLGEDAYLSFNHERIRLLSANSSGFWGLNGLFPSDTLADKEVFAAKSIGLNCLNSHKNLCSTNVLEEQDRLGLLRYLEPGGGVLALRGVETDQPSSIEALETAGTEPVTFSERYMEEKILHVVRDYRRHPSLAMYCLQNKLEGVVSYSRVAHMMRKIHHEDPSRILVLKAGDKAEGQVWMMPYNDTIRYDHGDGYSGWADVHTPLSSGALPDTLYKDATHFSFQTPYKREIAVLGELEGFGSPDNHSANIEYIKNLGGESFDLHDHQEIVNAYEAFLQQYNFASTFVNSQELFSQLATKAYDYWAQVIQTARLSEATDYITINNWESTSIDHHTGIVDNLRNFKTTPTVLEQALEPLMPLVQIQSTVFEKGKPVAFDLWMLNETNEQVRATIKVSMIEPDGAEYKIGEFRCPTTRGNKYVYLIKEQMNTKALVLPGMYTLKTELLGTGKVITNSKDFLVVDTDFIPQVMRLKVGYVSDSDTLKDYLQKHFKCVATPYQADQDYDVLVVSRSFGTRKSVRATGQLSGVENAYLYETYEEGSSKDLSFLLKDIPKGKAQVTLHFSALTAGNSVFDLAINDAVVEKGFDVLKAANGNKIVQKSFEVENAKKGLKLSFPSVQSGQAFLSAVSITVGTKVFKYNIGGSSYTDSQGTLWAAYQPAGILDTDIVRKVNAGMGLMVIAQDEDAADIYARALEANGLLNYQGVVARSDEAAMGSWVFTKKNCFYYDGLPTGTVMGATYQVTTDAAFGVSVTGDINVHAGFGKDHQRSIGVASFSTKAGQGEVSFFTLKGLLPEHKVGLNPLTAVQIWKNNLIRLGGLEGEIQEAE